MCIVCAHVCVLQTSLGALFRTELLVSTVYTIYLASVLMWLAIDFSQETFIALIDPLVTDICHVHRPISMYRPSLIMTLHKNANTML